MPDEVYTLAGVVVYFAGGKNMGFWVVAFSASGHGRVGLGCGVGEASATLDELPAALAASMLVGVVVSLLDAKGRRTAARRRRGTAGGRRRVVRRSSSARRTLLEDAP